MFLEEYGDVFQVIDLWVRQGKRMLDRLTEPLPMAIGDDLINLIDRNLQ
jgi:hypothetical protein